MIDEKENAHDQVQRSSESAVQNIVMYNVHETSQLGYLKKANLCMVHPNWQPQSKMFHSTSQSTAAFPSTEKSVCLLLSDCKAKMLSDSGDHQVMDRLQTILLVLLGNSFIFHI